MKAYVLVGVLGLGLGVGVGTAGEVVASKEVAWQTDYARARAEARQTGRPLLVVFR